MRNQYTGIEYLLSKMCAEFPLDALFSTVFAIVLKHSTGLRCSLGVLCRTYSLLTMAGASLGFALGSLANDGETAKAMGMPVMVLLMIVGVINPGGVDTEDTPPLFVRVLKLMSPIRWAIEALCVAEYRDMEFSASSKSNWFSNIKSILSDLSPSSNAGGGPRMGAYALVQNGNQVLDAIGLGEAKYGSLMKGLGVLTGVNLLISLFGLTFCGPSFVVARGETVVLDHDDGNDIDDIDDIDEEEEYERQEEEDEDNDEDISDAPLLDGSSRLHKYIMKPPTVR
mmetsp:Transcript_3353/g.5037  ORF Transcript_3353/g.5037 Transcript_3353/m.5037 type:complete len:283 (+) Transcript_3353:276-1124(+)